MKRLLPLGTLFSLLLLLVACQSKPRYYSESGTRFHTLYHITYRSEKPLTEAIEATMTAFEQSLNPFVPTSLISRINANETDSLDTMTAEVISIAARVSQLSGGAYDITGAPLFNIWGFGTKKGVTRHATAHEIDSILSFVGYDKITIDTIAMRITKSDPRLSIIPSSLSKGYVTDLVAATLERHGVTDYMVEIGGEVVCSGHNPEGHCWSIGINRPVEDNTSQINEVMSRIEICNKVGIATSGDYRNYLLLDGEKVGHTIDVRTGYPAQQDLLSVTVIAPTCAEADAWATTFMALGSADSKALLPQVPYLQVLFILADEKGGLKVYEHGITSHPLTPQP